MQQVLQHLHHDIDVTPEDGLIDKFILDRFEYTGYDASASLALPAPVVDDAKGDTSAPMVP